MTIEKTRVQAISYMNVASPVSPRITAASQRGSRRAAPFAEVALGRRFLAAFSTEIDGVAVAFWRASHNTIAMLRKLADTPTYVVPDSPIAGISRNPAAS